MKTPRQLPSAINSERNAFGGNGYKVSNTNVVRSKEV